MSKPIIQVRGLSKTYRLGAIGATTLREAFSTWTRRVRSSGTINPSGGQDFQALTDVSFDVQPGEVIGIIGRNGSGKSTLLKILSRITEPTRGEAILRGRVASLLEVGTGFHPDLTGRENIFLNGAILGMSRAEIRRKLDEIVAFSEVGRFLDTPVKRYSSGMYVRLAFAVAAHLEPEILIVDEVLAVGDAAFQKKCLGKMESVSQQEGRTILFVSHNLAAVRALTHRCVYLQDGCVQSVGSTPVVLDHYAQTIGAGEKSARGRGKNTCILHTAMLDAEGRKISVHDGRTRTFLEIDLETDGTSDLILECYLQDGEGTKLAVCSPGRFSNWRLPAESGRWRINLSLDIPPLASGIYYFDVATTHVFGGYDHYISEAITCEVDALVMRPALWEYRRNYRAGFFVMDDDSLPKTDRLGK